jgi:hypothetical protein
VAEGCDPEATILELATLYSVIPEIIRARASRSGGILESAKKLRRRQDILDAAKSFPLGLLQVPTLEEWLSSRCGLVTSDELASASSLLEARITQNQDRGLKLMLMGMKAAERTDLPENPE